MTKYEINGLQPFHIDTGNPDAAWDEVRLKCGFLSEWGVEMLREGLNGFVQTIILEPYYTCKDHRNLHSNFYSKKFVEVSSNCRRLHFLSRAGVQVNDLLADPKALQADYLGFSVIRPVRERCLGRTVIDPAKVGKGLKDDYFVLRTPFRVNINGAALEVRGYPFTSQDADATVCAHSALWGACRFLSEKYPHYRELYPFDLIRMTETTKGRVVPYRGMTYTDYCKILTDFGTFPVCRMLQKITSTGVAFDPDVFREVFKDLYTYVESGFPVLASVRLPQGVGHVVTLVGHTIDRGKDPGVATGFVDSSHFLKQFVVMDDNRSPYQRLGYEADKESYGVFYEKNGRRLGIQDITTLTCPLPEKVFLPAESAREKAVECCNLIASSLKLTGKEPFVTRLFLTTSVSFKRRKLAQSMSKKYGPDRAATFVLDVHLPHFIWVMEVSPLESYKKEMCTAEIVLDATAGVAENGLIYLRIGEQVHFGAQFTKIAGAKTEYPQYTHNLGERDLA